MLPTPAKFHYIFNLRRPKSYLARHPRTHLQEVVSDVPTVLALWKHECQRVIADRFFVRNFVLV